MLKLKSWFAKNDRKIVFENIFWLSLDKVGRQGINFILTAYIARYLDVELFGIWNYAIAFVLLFSFFSTLGIYNQLLRDFVKTPEKTEFLLGSAFIIKLGGGVVTLISSQIAIHLLRADTSQLYFIIFIIGLGYIFQSLDVIDFFFQSQLKSRLTTISRFISFTFFSSLKIIFVFLKLPFVYFIWAQSGELLLSGVLLAFVYNKNFGRLSSWKMNLHFAKAMLMESMPILFAEVAIIIYMRIDQIMVGEMLGAKSLGIFSVAVRLSEIWYVVPGVICSAMFPAIIKSFMNDRSEYLRKIQKLYDILVWLSIAIAVGVSLLAKTIILYTFGPHFLAASSILMVHVWSTVFVFVGFASNQQLVLEQSTKISFYRTLFGVFANVALNYFLIPIYGPMGAALATLAAQGCSNWLSNLFFAKSRDIFFIELRTLNITRFIKLKS